MCIIETIGKSVKKCNDFFFYIYINGSFTVVINILNKKFSFHRLMVGDVDYNNLIFFFLSLVFFLFKWKFTMKQATTRENQSMVNWMFVFLLSFQALIMRRPY